MRPACRQYAISLDAKHRRRTGRGGGGSSPCWASQGGKLPPWRFGHPDDIKRKIEKVCPEGGKIHARGGEVTLRGGGAGPNIFFLFYAPGQRSPMPKDQGSVPGDQGSSSEEIRGSASGDQRTYFLFWVSGDQGPLPLLPWSANTGKCFRR